MITLRSLGVRNFRIWAAGAFVSNVGAWMQRVAQDWIVLAELTDHNATAMGIVTGLQFGPQLLLLPLTGLFADSLDRRKLLMVTQACMGMLALLLGLLTILELVRIWHVYLFAFLLGCTAAFDAPVRHSFVSELVQEAHLSNAVALNSASFHLGRMAGPALAGILIAVVGTGWVFLVNALSFVAVLLSLRLLRADELYRAERLDRAAGGVLGGVRYVLGRGDLQAILFVLFLVGTFALNFSIFIATMSVTVFRMGPGGFGLLTSAMAAGSVIGALLAARREQPSMHIILAGAVMMCIGLTGAALAQNVVVFAMTLVLVGIAAQTLTATSIGKVQLSTTALLRGRVLAILMAVTVGATPVGAPLVGWVADEHGPRLAIAMGAASCLVAAAVMFWFINRKPR